MSKIAVIGQSEYSRTIANELNDLRERWLIRKRIEAEALDDESADRLTAINVDLGIDFANLPATPEGALALYNKVLEQVNEIHASMARLRYKGNKKDRIKKATLEAEKVYKCAALGLIKQNLKAVNREAYTNKPKTLKLKPTLSDTERLVGLTGPDKLIGEAWLLLKQLSFEDRVTYSGQEWDFIDTLRAYLRQQSYSLPDEA